MEYILTILRETWWLAFLPIAIALVIVTLMIVAYVVYLSKQIPQDSGAEAALEQVTEWHGKSPEQIIEHNERMMKRKGFPNYEDRIAIAKDLITHPTIQCRFLGCYETIGTMGAYYHDKMNLPVEQRKRPAIWLRDMRYPECPSCYVEDPYE